MGSPAWIRIRVWVKEWCRGRIPSILWDDGADREAQMEDASVGWKALKDYVREKEVELRLARETKKKGAEQKKDFAHEDFWVNDPGKKKKKLQSI
ncbi:hypothetical protein SUGI_1198670 [Cryptomeria japonica]|nr:hypothetical protein SUGI_1198670 [Cryptomeria japonica]